MKNYRISWQFMQDELPCVGLINDVNDWLLSNDIAITTGKFVDDGELSIIWAARLNDPKDSALRVLKKDVVHVEQMFEGYGLTHYKITEL